MGWSWGNALPVVFLAHRCASQQRNHGVLMEDGSLVLGMRHLAGVSLLKSAQVLGGSGPHFKSAGFYWTLHGHGLERREEWRPCPVLSPSSSSTTQLLLLEHLRGDRCVT